MMLGMALSTFTLVHVIISLIAIATGFVVLAGFIRGRSLDMVDRIFLAMTALTNITGFMFPFERVTPGIVLGVLSVVVLAIAVPAKYVLKLAGKWRTAYVVTATIALYFNFFVLIVQSFQKIPALHTLAPSGTENPFKLTQLVTLAAFIALGIKAVRGFKASPTAVSAARA